MISSTDSSASEATAEVLVATRNLRKCFGNKVAVDDLSMAINRGEIFGLVGPDGAGKTTTMRLLCAAMEPTAGQVTIAGFRMDREPELGRAAIGYLPQRFSLYEELTVLENLRFFAETRGLSSSAWWPRAMEILTFVGLDDFTGRRAGHLSGGMKQKLGLAAALVHEPRVLLLDEPTTGVDPVTRQDFWQLIMRLISENRVAVLVTTPYMDEATRCNRIGFMRQGHLLLEGTPSRLRARLSGQIIEVTGQPLPKLRALASSDRDVESVHSFGEKLHLRVKAGKAGQVAGRLEQHLNDDSGIGGSVRLIEPQLEDVFMALLEMTVEPESLHE